MSAKTDQGRNPFEETGQTQSTIQRLVATAVEPQQPEETSARKRPCYPSEVERAARKITLDVDPDTVARLREVARQEGAGRYVSKVAQALLDYALEAYDSGRLKFELHPVVVGRRLEAVEADGSGN